MTDFSSTLPLTVPLPPELPRWPGTLKFLAAKPPATTRIFIFGESAAMGYPHPSFGACRFLEVLLR